MTESSRTTIRTERDGHVLVVTLDRPEARNACNAAMWEELGDVLEEEIGRASCRERV